MDGIPAGDDRASALARERTRLRLDHAYDGTGFSGWARQPGRRTVAGLLAEVLGLVLGPYGVEGLTVAGRTDAGVHATGQVCHVDVPAERWHALASSLLVRLSRLLPPDIRVQRIAEVPPTFDARFSALWRRYQYRVCDAVWGAPPLRHRDTVAWPRPLDIARLDEAGRALVGEHDFAAFCRRKEQGSTVRQVFQIAWHRDSEGIVVASVTADAFCQSMVRSIMGALLAVGDGRRAVEWPAALRRRRERAGEIVVAPPHGLTLVEVAYPEDPAEFGARATRTRNVRQIPGSQ